MHDGRWGTAWRAVVAIGVVALLGVGLAACSSSSSTSAAKASKSPSSSTTPSSTTRTAAGPAVDTAVSSTYGRILVDADGRTLYELTADSTGRSTCSSACQAVWPPLALPAGEHATAGPGTQASCLSGSAGVATEPSGAHQVAYCGHPLYTFSGDSAAGQVHGFGIHSFGGTWYPVGVDGSPVEHAVAASSSTSTSTSSGGYSY